VMKICCVEILMNENFLGRIFTDLW